LPKIEISENCHSGVLYKPKRERERERERQRERERGGRNIEEKYYLILHIF